MDRHVRYVKQIWDKNEKGEGIGNALNSGAVSYAVPELVKRPPRRDKEDKTRFSFVNSPLSQLDDNWPSWSY
jgi:hypothetical protein